VPALRTLEGDVSADTWRVGTKVGRTIYDAENRLIGVMDTPDLAVLAAAAPRLLDACHAFDAALAEWKVGNVPGVPDAVWALRDQVLAAILRATTPWRPTR
jgi:hypothetical protein